MRTLLKRGGCSAIYSYPRAARFWALKDTGALALGEAGLAAYNFNRALKNKDKMASFRHFFLYYTLLCAGKGGWRAAKLDGLGWACHKFHRRNARGIARPEHRMKIMGRRIHV